MTIDYVGELMSDYLKDESVDEGLHTIDTILSVAIEAAVEQGALGRFKKDEPNPQEEEDKAKADVIDAQSTRVPNDEGGDQPNVDAPPPSNS